MNRSYTARNLGTSLFAALSTFRNHLLLGMMGCALLGGGATARAGDVTISVDTANADASESNPFQVMVHRFPGTDFTVKIKNIKKGDTGAVKAQKIADGINNDPAAKQGVKATVTASGEVKISPLPGQSGVTGLRNMTDPTKEKFDKLAMNVPANGGLDWSAASAFASGFDPDGMPSILRMGLPNVYVSEIYIAPGTPVELLFTDLASDLFAHGIETTLDLGGHSLMLKNELAPDQAFVFGNTDVSMDTSGWIVSSPEPSSLALLGLGICTTAMRRRNT